MQYPHSVNKNCLFGGTKVPSSWLVQPAAPGVPQPQFRILQGTCCHIAYTKQAPFAWRESTMFTKQLATESYLCKFSWR